MQIVFFLSLFFVQFMFGIYFTSTSAVVFYCVTPQIFIPCILSLSNYILTVNTVYYHIVCLFSSRPQPSMSASRHQ